MTMDALSGQTPAIDKGTAPTRPAADAASPPPSQSPKPAGDTTHVGAAAAGSAAGAVSLVSDGPTLTTFFRGFHQGQAADLGAQGFFGSSFVGGTANMKTLHADGFSLALHIKAPGNDREDTMQFTRSGGAFVNTENVRFIPTYSDNNHTMTLTNASNSHQKLVLSVPKPGFLTFTSYGFEPKGDGKTLTATAK